MRDTTQQEDSSLIYSRPNTVFQNTKAKGPVLYSRTMVVLVNSFNV